MTPSTSARRLGALALVAGAAAAAACGSDPDVRGLTAPAASNAPFLLRYVALGNSITAGFQSAGINDSTQRASYANLLARAAGVRFAYPALQNPGCPPPLTNLLAGTRAGGGTGATCPGRALGAAGLTDLLNNVAVPGANSFDPTGAASVLTGTGRDTVRIAGGYSALTRVVLGNLTQVQRAAQANPTFASVWIGNNDVLAFAIGGDTAQRNPATGASLGRITPPAAFAANYAATVDQLRAGSPGLARGVLIGVVDVTNTPQIFQLSVFNSASTAAGVNAYNPQAFAVLRALFATAANGTARPATFQLGFSPNCNASQAAISLSALQAVNAALPANAPGFVFNCAPGAAPSPVLDDAERAVFTARVAAYNAYIRAKADSVGFFYYDPNVRLAALRASGQILPFPNLASAAQPFGGFVSLDGVHPSTRTHVILASDLRDSLNAKYGATIPAIDTTGLWAGAPTF